MSKFIEDSKFFFTDFHKGTVNIILHLISFTVMFYGLAVKNTLLVFIGLCVIDEFGHIYNYFIRFKRDRRYGPRMIPYQLFYAAIGIIILLKMFNWY